MEEKKKEGRKKERSLKPSRRLLTSVCWKNNTRLDVSPEPLPKDSRTSWNNRSKEMKEITTQKRYRMESLRQSGTSVGRVLEVDPGSAKKKARALDLSVCGGVGGSLSHPGKTKNNCMGWQDGSASKGACGQVWQA